MSRTPASELNPSTSFEKSFQHVLELASLIFDGYAREKGDSWVFCDIEFLEKQLEEKIKGYKESFVNKFEQSLDIVNYALMIAMRKFLEKYDNLNWPYIKLKTVEDEDED